MDPASCTFKYSWRKKDIGVVIAGLLLLPVVISAFWGAGVRRCGSNDTVSKRFQYRSIL